MQNNDSKDKKDIFNKSYAKKDKKAPNNPHLEVIISNLALSPC